MTKDYWELETIEDIVIKSLSKWVIFHTDLVDLVDIDAHRLRLRIIPDEIIPRFKDYQSFLDTWLNSQSSITRITGYWPGGKYFLGINLRGVEIVFNEFSPVIIDLNTHRLSINVIDGSTGKSTLVKGLSPTNYSRMMSKPESFPKFIRIGYEYEKSTTNYT